MNNIKKVFLAILLFPTLVFAANGGLIERIFFNNKVKIAIPENFIKAEDSFINERFPGSENRPKIIYRSEDGLATIALNMTKNSGDRQSIYHFFRDVKQSIRDNYPEHRFLKTDVIRNRSLAIVEATFPNPGGQIVYNMMAFRYIDDSFFFFNFSCPENEMGQYQHLARDIAENIKLFKK